MAKTQKSVLITGCSSGIGEATAKRLVLKGWRVVATARRIDSIDHLRELGCETMSLDVTKETSMQVAIAAAGDIDALVNNAGYSLSGAVESVEMDAVRRQFETNVFGLIRMCQLLLPQMRKRGSGRIINISSMGGKLTFPGGGVYHATKHSVEALSDALRFEVAGFGVDVVVIQPGLIRTGFSAAAQSAMSQGADMGTGPYAAFNAAVAKATKETYETGPLAKLGGPPDAVAKSIHKALSVRKPKTRYKVTPSAHMLMTQRRWMSDRMWDGFLRGNFPEPGKS